MLLRTWCFGFVGAFGVTGLAVLVSSWIPAFAGMTVGEALTRFMSFFESAPKVVGGSQKMTLFDLAVLSL